METKRTGYLDFTPNVTWAAVRLHYEESWDIAENISAFTVTAIEVKSTKYTAAYYVDGIVQINGQPVMTFNSATGEVLANVNSTGTWHPIAAWATPAEPLSGSIQIPHHNDGTKTVDITLTGNRFRRFAFYTADEQNGNGWGVSQTHSLALTDIPRASPVAATDAAVGAVSTVTVTRRNSEYTHSVAFSFGSLSGWLDADGSILEAEKKLTASSIPFAIPETFYTQLTQTPYGSCKLLCTTYWGDTRIGQTQETTFRVTAELPDCTPVVTGAVEDVNPVTVALTGDASTLVRYASTALCTISAQARKGAEITSRTIAGVPVAEDSLTLEQVETDTFGFEATDSRGFSGRTVITTPMIAYVPLTCNITAKRTNPTGDEVLLTVKGNCFNGWFGAAQNALTLQYTVGNLSGQMEAVPEGNTYTAAAVLTGLDYRGSHSITVTAADKITSLCVSTTAGKGVPVFDWGENDFAFHVPVEMGADFTVGGKSRLDWMYPVDAVYMSAGEADPGSFLGGIWQQMENTMGIHMWKRIS